MSFFLNSPLNNANFHRLININFFGHLWIQIFIEKHAKSILIFSNGWMIYFIWYNIISRWLLFTILFLFKFRPQFCSLFCFISSLRFIQTSFRSTRTNGSVCLCVKNIRICYWDVHSIVCSLLILLPLRFIFDFESVLAIRNSAK